MEKPGVGIDFEAEEAEYSLMPKDTPGR